MKKKLKITISALVILITIFAIVFNQILFIVIFQIGYSDVYEGNNVRGNKIMNFAISHIKNPNSQLFHALSVQNTKNGNYDHAMSALKKAYDLDPESCGGYYGWVLLYYYHDYEKSLDVLNKYDELTPNFSDAPVGECIHYLKGLAYLKLGKNKKAIDEFNISIANTIKHAGKDWVFYLVYLHKGLAYFNEGMFNDAQQAFNKAISRNENCSEAYYYKGLSEILSKNKVEGCRLLRISNNLIQKKHKAIDQYIELPFELYLQDVKNDIKINCNE